MRAKMKQEDTNVNGNSSTAKVDNTKDESEPTKEELEADFDPNDKGKFYFFGLFCINTLMEGLSSVIHPYFLILAFIFHLESSTNKRLPQVFRISQFAINIEA